MPFDFLGSHFTLIEGCQIIVKSHKKFSGRELPLPASFLIVKWING